MYTLLKSHKKKNLSIFWFLQVHMYIYTPITFDAKGSTTPSYVYKDLLLQLHTKKKRIY